MYIAKFKVCIYLNRIVVRMLTQHQYAYSVRCMRVFRLLALPQRLRTRMWVRFFCLTSN